MQPIFGSILPRGDEMENKKTRISLKSERLIDEDDADVGHHRFSVKDGGHPADTLGGVAVAADAGFRAGGFQFEAFGAHGSGDGSNSFKCRIQIRRYLVHADDDDHLGAPERHGIVSVSDAVHVDDFTGCRNGVGTAKKAIAPPLPQPDVHIGHARCRQPVVENGFSGGRQGIGEAEFSGCDRAAEPE